MRGEISVREAGARGGRATFELRGREFLREIGKKGGRRTANLYGALLAEFGRKGGRPRRHDIDHYMGEETSDKKEADSGRPPGLLPHPYFITERSIKLTPASRPNGYKKLQGMRKRLINAAKTPRDKALVAVASIEGIHTSEIIRLEEGNIDRTSQTLTFFIENESVKLRCINCKAALGKQQSYCSKCGNKIDNATQEIIKKRRQRIISIDQETLRLLDEYLNWRVRFPYRGSFLFPVSRQRVWQLLRTIVRRAEYVNEH